MFSKSIFTTKVAKDITLDDLNATDEERLRVGASQILPCTDTAGRSIFFCMEKRKESIPVCWESEVRKSDLF